MSKAGESPATWASTGASLLALPGDRLCPWLLLNEGPSPPSIAWRHRILLFTTFPGLGHDPCLHLAWLFLPWEQPCHPPQFLITAFSQPHAEPLLSILTSLASLSLLRPLDLAWITDKRQQPLNRLPISSLSSSPCNPPTHPSHHVASRLTTL